MNSTSTTLKYYKYIIHAKRSEKATMASGAPTEILNLSPAFFFEPAGLLALAELEPEDDPVGEEPAIEDEVS